MAWSHVLLATSNMLKRKVWFDNSIHCVKNFYLAQLEYKFEFTVNKFVLCTKVFNVRSWGPRTRAIILYGFGILSQQPFILAVLHRSVARPSCANARYGRGRIHRSYATRLTCSNCLLYRIYIVSRPSQIYGDARMEIEEPENGP